MGEVPGELETRNRAVAIYVDAPGVSMPVPALIADAGEQAARATLEVFTARIPNAHTRRAYGRAVFPFCSWCERERVSLVRRRCKAAASPPPSRITRSGPRASPSTRKNGGRPEPEEVNEADYVDDGAGLGGGGRIDPVEVVEERDVRAADLEPIGDPAVVDLLRQLAERGITPEQAAEGVRRQRTNRQDVREARRAALNERVQNEAGGILGRRGINPKGKTLDRARRQNNFAWVAAELHRRVNDAAGGALGDRQNFTLEQVNAGHDALPGIVQALEAELPNATR